MATKHLTSISSKALRAVAAGVNLVTCAPDGTCITDVSVVSQLPAPKKRDSKYFA